MAVSGSHALALCCACGSLAVWGPPESLQADVLTGVQRGPVARGGHVEVAPATFQVPRKRGDEWGALSERVSSGAEVGSVAAACRG